MFVGLEISLARLSFYCRITSFVLIYQNREISLVVVVFEIPVKWLVGLRFSAYVSGY